MQGTKSMGAKDIENEARRLKEMGLTVTAARYYLRLGKKSKAAEAYERGGWFGSAAELRIEMGAIRKAAIDYIKGGWTARAAKLLESIGDVEGAKRIRQVAPLR